MGNQCVKDSSSDDEGQRRNAKVTGASVAPRAKGNKYEATERIVALEHVEHPHAKMCEASKIEKNFREFSRVIAPNEAALAIAACDTFPAGSKQLLIAGEDRSISMLNYETGHVMKQWKRAHDRDINCLTNPHRSSGVFCSGSRDASIRLWKASESTPLHVMKGHKLNVTSVAMHPEGHLIASGSRDNTVRLWDMESGSELASQDVKLNLVHFVRFVPPMQCLVQGGEDLTVRLWDLRGDATAGTKVGLELRATYGNFDYHPTCCDGYFNDPSRCHSIFTGHNGFNHQGSMLLEWDIRMGRQVKQFNGHNFSVRSLHLMRSETLAAMGLQGQLMSASDDGSVRFWPVNDTGKPSETANTVENGTELGGDQTATAADLSTNRIHVTDSRKYEIQEGQVTCIDETEDGLILMSLRNGTAVILRPSGTREEQRPVQRYRYVGNPATTDK